MNFYELQITEKVKQVEEARERLRKVWEDRRQHYEQLYGLHTFLRDAEQLNNTSSSQEVTILLFGLCVLIYIFQ